MDSTDEPGTFSRIDVRKALLSRLENADWERTILIETIVMAEDLDRDVVEDVLEQLERGGEVYTVNGEVRRTP